MEQLGICRHVRRGIKNDNDLVELRFTLRIKQWLPSTSLTFHCPLFQQVLKDRSDLFAWCTACVAAQGW